MGRAPRTGRRASAWLGLSVLVATLACPGCVRGPSRADAGAAGEVRGPWLVLSGGLLVPGAPAARAGGSDDGFLPWTLQARVADLAFRDGTLYAAISGHGVATLPLPPPRAARFATTRDRGLFAGRTVTELFSDPEGIVLHLYSNELLAATAPEAEQPTGGPFALVALRGGAGGAPLAFEPLAVPFHAAHPAWEAVAAVRISPAELALEWKRSGEERTEFAYTRFAWRSGEERASDRSDFRASWGFLSAAAAPDPGTRALFAAVVSRLTASRPEARPAVHLTVRADGEPDARYRFQPAGYADEQDPDLVSVPARKAAGELWALTADGALFSARPGEPSVAARELPALPAGHRYTGFVVIAAGDARWVAASWEEERFTRVGRAGLYLAPLGPAKP